MDVSSCGCVLPNNIPGYDGVSRISGGPEGQGTARASAVLRRETHLLVLFAVVLQQACCDGKGFRTELAVPCYAFTMQESSKMIKRRTRKRTSGFPLFIGAMPCGDMVCGGVSGTARTVGPFCGRENGIRPLCFGKRRVRDAGDLGALPGGGVFFASALL